MRAVSSKAARAAVPLPLHTHSAAAAAAPTVLKTRSQPVFVKPPTFDSAL
ncbi:MAG TPA: hypothetical protein VHN37_10245 [Actinomycetota bacterium]|nr:hypothetical protein [Actinomycetota bacterium]